MDDEDVYNEKIVFEDKITFLEGFTPSERNGLGVLVGFSLL